MAMMTLLRLACVFPFAAWSLQAPPASRGKESQCTHGRRVKPGDCLKKMTPNLLFIGQAHSGSTSLSQLMELHPAFSVGDMKEHHFFDNGVKHVHRAAATSFEEYKNQFCVACETTVSMDATMEYINLAYEGEHMVKEIRRRLGDDIKIMMMFRDPVDLVFSDTCNQGKLERPSTPQNISTTQISVTEPLSVWMQVFPNRKNWLFLNSEEFFTNQQKVLDKVFKFAGARPFKVSMNMTDEEGNAYQDSGRRRCTMKATSKERKAYFSSGDNVNDKMRLEKLTGLDLNWKDE